VIREVKFSPEARGDLYRLYDYISVDAGPERAKRFADQIVDACRKLDLFPERGVRRDDLRPGLRVTTFRRRVSIAYQVGMDSVVIVRISYGGRDFGALFGEAPGDDGLA
jgi:toxin ParE1/3/4